MKLAILALTALALLFPTVSNASVILSDSGRGWIGSPSSLNGNDPNNNYFAGNLGPPYRDHFDFQIPALSGTLTAATLTLDNSVGHSGGTNTYSVSGLGAYGSYGFANIGTGTPYGSVNISGDGIVTISLDAAALAAITADQGSTFSLGGVNSAENTSGYDFGFTGFGSSTTLTLNGVSVSSVPEPATLTLLGTGFFAIGGFGLCRRRRRAVGSNPAR